MSFSSLYGCGGCLIYCVIVCIVDLVVESVGELGMWGFGDWEVEGLGDWGCFERFWTVYCHFFSFFFSSIFGPFLTVFNCFDCF